MATGCEGCGHCCHDMSQIFGNMDDALAFAAVGNPLIFHQSLIELNSVLEQGLHVFKLSEGPNPEVRMTMVGYCGAFNHSSGLCNAHSPSTLPKICRNLLIAGSDCMAFRAANGIKD